MADKIQLPNGAFFPVKEGESKEQALAVAQQMYPDAFAAAAAPTPKQSGSGLGDIARSFGLGAVGATGALASTFGADNAAARGLAGAGESLQAGLSDKRKAELQAQAARMQAAEKSGSTWEEIKAGLLNVAEAPVQSAAQALGSFVPVVATLPLAKLGLGVRAIMAVRGAIGAAQGAGSVKQNVYEAVLKAETEEGKPPAQAQAAAVKAQEYVGANLDQILLGAGLGGVAGTTGAERLIPGGARATAGAAQQAVAKRIGERAASGVAGAAAEMPLEGLQGGQERLASNLALQRTGRDVGTFTGVAGQAAQEALTGGLGGGALGVALPDRTLSTAAAAERKKQREAEAALAEQERLAQEEKTAAEEAERNSLPYALQVGQQYDTLLQDFQTKQKALKKPGKDADPATKAEYSDAQKELQALSAQLKELVPEYRRTKTARAQAQEEARKASMDPFDYMMEQAGEVSDRKVDAPAEDTTYEDSGLAFQEPLIPSVERRKAEEAELARVSAVPAAYAAERIKLAQEQRLDPTGNDYLEYLLQDPYKASLVVETSTPLPGLSERESDMLRNNLAKRLKAMGKEELAARQAELQAQKPGKEPVNPMAQFLADQDMLDIARQEGMTESDIAFVERQAAMPREVIQQGDLFGEQRVGQAAGVTEQRGNIADKLDEMQRQLDIAYAQRNTERGGQYRETIRGLIEQIRDLQARTAMPTTGELGAATADLQGQLGQLPESLQAQRAGEAARQAALTRVANKEEGARSDTISGLIEEIKAARGALRPETITQIEKEAGDILSTLERYGDQGNLLAATTTQLDQLSQRWRSGTERGETATRTVTPTTTSAEMLREQMDRAFAQNDMSTRTERRERYAPQDMAVLNQIADNFKAFAANPDRLNMAGEWLNRLTTTGRSSPEMTRDVQAELARLEEGKRQDSGQLELQERFMPKAVAPQAETRVSKGKAQFFSPEDVGPLQGSPAERYAPAKKSTAFATAAEFQKYLASDALKVLRQAMGMGKDTASRMHARLELFSKKVENVAKQLASLEARKQALQTQRKADTNTAIDLLQTAEANLNKIYERLDAELADLQTEYLQARQQFDFTAQTVSDIGQKIADNLAAFQSTDAAVVETAQNTADAKTAYAAAIEQPVSKRTFSTLRKARREVITAIEKQITASRKAGADETVLAFLNADLNLQLQMQAEEKQLDQDAQVLLNAGLALEEAAATQKRSRKNQKAIKQAQQELAAALEIKGGVAKETGDIDTQLAQVEVDIAAAETELNRVQRIADTTQTTRQAEASARAENERASAFQRALDEVKIEKPTRAEQEAITARDKAERAAFQATTARLAAIPGTRIDFAKRREMLELVNAADSNFATLAQNIEDAEVGIEEMQIAIAIADDAVADAKEELQAAQAEVPATGLYAKQNAEQRARRIDAATKTIAQFQNRIEIANSRIEQLRGAVGRYETQSSTLQVAYDKAVKATSSDPEIYKAVTGQLENRITKLNKNIAENEDRIANGVDKRGRPLADKTLVQMRKRLAKYKSELRRTSGKLSNRLGITRTDVLTGEKFEGQRSRALSGEEKIQLAEAEQRKEEYERLTEEIEDLKVKKQKAEAAGKPKAPALIQARINKLEDERTEVAPRAAGAVSQATRVQSAAPGKFRTGTAESKADQGVSRQPIMETRTVALPTANEAVEEANAFAERLNAAKTDKQRTKLLNERDEVTRAQLEDALFDNVEYLKNRVLSLEQERLTLRGAQGAAAATRLAAIDIELMGATNPQGDVITKTIYDYLQIATKQLADYEAAIAKAEAAEIAAAEAKEDAERAEYGAFITELGDVEGGTEIRGFDMGVADDTGGFDFDARYRVAKTTGPSMSVPQVQKAYDALTGEWVNKPQTVVVADEKGLPVRLLNQAKRDDMLGKIPGIYDPVSGKVYLVASNLRSVNDVILTTVHEIAGHFGLQKVLGDSYTKTMNDIYNGNAAIRKAADAKMEQVASLKQETAVEEALAEQAELDPNAPDTRSAMRKIYDTLKKWVRDTFGFKDTITDAQVNQIIANARKFVIEGGEEGKGTAGVLTPAYRSKATAPANALEELALDITTQPKTMKEKLGSNLALQAEMNAVDMRAGLRDALKAGDDTLFTQAMYHVRKAEQKMAQMFTVMNSGPLVAYKDEKGLVGYRSSNQNSARDVFDAIADIPVDDPQKKTNIAQAYMVAQRAANKGLSKLDLGELGITEDKLKAALAAANADPALKAALENVRRKYNAYNKGMIEFLASTGRISKKTAADLLKDGDYVPYYRVRDNGMAELNFGNNVTFNVGDIRRQPYLAELKGGQTKLLPLNEAIQQNTLLLTDMALTNNATKSVAYGLQALGKGMGPVDPKTGKPGNLMPIKSGPGPADARTIRFYQEPDPKDPKDTGERHLVVNTKGTAAEGIPAEMVVQSLEGASLALPGFLKLGGVAADWLRAGVTRTPLYIARKLLREPMAAAFTGGLNSNAFSAVFKAGAEFVRMSRGTSDAQAKLIEKGLIQSNIFAGDMSDMKKMALQLASGKDQNAFDKVLAAADRYAMRADAATLALVLKNAQENGLSEVEADMMTMESMNFYKRGLSPTLQYASRLIPFFNAQIQGLNVLAKAARGNMPFEEQQQIKRKFFNNAMLLMATGIVYAMAMEDDETFRNARPRDKYANFFLPIPGVDEPLKLPIPFEAGYFYSLAVAAVDAMRAETDGKAQWSALKDLFMGSIPGYSSMGMPQIVKPAFEVWTNKNFLTGGSVEPQRMQGYTTEERYLATTTELAKQLSKAVPILSPIQIEHLVRGYFGVLPLVAVAGANSLFEREGKGEKPEARASDMPLIGSAFQKKYGGGDSDVVYREAKEAMDAKTTFNKMLKEGRREEAVAYRDENRTELTLATAAGQYRQLVGRINEDVRRTQERSDLNAQEKRIRLDKLEEAKQQAADRFLALRRKAEAATGG
jgi:hypothetical protein